MRSAFRSPLVLGLVTLCTAGSALALSSFDSTEAGWTPLVSLWGKGDPQVAVKNLGQLTTAYSAVLHRTDVDKATQEFVDDAIEQLSDFNLEGFHKLLPEERNGFRELWVRGELKGDRYAVRRADGTKAFRVSMKGPRKGLADLSEMIRAKLNTGKSDERSYLIGLRVGLGVSKLEWTPTVQAITEFGRLVSTADSRAGASDKLKPSAAAVSQVKSLHPKLAPEDVQSAAVLWEAYPALSKALSQIGQLEDVREVDTGKGYQHVTVRMSELTDRLAKRHAPFAKHMKKMGKIGRFDIRWVDSKNRTLMNWFIDSETLQIRNECYLKEGQLLPFSGKKVFADEPVDPFSDYLKNTRAIVQARLQLLGVVVQLKNLKLDLFYQPHGSYAEMGATLTSSPGVEIEGAALGFVPTGLIDAFIPGNIRSLTLDFLRVASKGNEKKGVVASLNLGSEQPGGDGVIEAGLDIEALDNYLVKIGVGMVNERLIPSDEVLKDAKGLLTEIHDAFSQDLSRYKSRVGG